MIWVNGDARAKRPSNITSGAISNAAKLPNGWTTFGNFVPLKRTCANSPSRSSKDRISTVDRNVLRLAIYEMLYRDDIPPIVSINEAIELAKTFGGAESGGFVNGILDRVRKDLTRPSREAVSSSPKEGQD